MSMARDAAHNLTQAAYEGLRADLLACRILPGRRLRIQDLCDRFSVSLGAVREALSRLTSEGLVLSEPQRGFRAAPISVAELRDLTMVRIEIDSLCLARAVAAGSVEWESRLVAAFHRLSRTPERVPSDPTRSNDDWADAHAAFHLALVEGVDSPWLLRLHGQLYAQSERYRRLSIPLGTDTRNVAREHQDIMEAVLAREGRLAVELLTRHLAMTTEILLRADIEGYAAGRADAGPQVAIAPDNSRSRDRRRR
jgi:DNA-binding GntR family transcriptional regulator